MLLLNNTLFIKILLLFVVDIYVCDAGVIMFSQSLTTCQRSLTTMQIQIQGLLQFSVQVFPTAEVRSWLTDFHTRLWKCVYHLLPFYTLLYRETFWESNDY